VSGCFCNLKLDQSLKFLDNNIYVGGNFTSPILQNIMSVNINTNRPDPLANGLDSTVLAVYYDKLSNRLYAGGEFRRDGSGLTLLNYISYFNFSIPYPFLVLINAILVLKCSSK
jgi:hypothetical protein